MKQQHLVKGLTRLMKLRCGAFRFAPWLAQVELILLEFRDVCPMCQGIGKEDEAHLLLSRESFPWREKDYWPPGSTVRNYAWLILVGLLPCS